MTLFSEGLFTAPPFDRVVIVRIYQEEDGFHIYAKPWFGWTYDSMPMEFAKDRAKRAIEGNIGAAFGASYVGNVDWDDDQGYLRLLKPLCEGERLSRR